ncbi:MAG: hypothetical protein M3384_10805 [Acidobacteriota bacterium]|nr:hypothetical protein [Acidobacteriota bacterium]
MKNRKSGKGKLSGKRILLLLSGCLCLISINIQAQTTNAQTSDAENKIPAPSEEQFKPADGIILHAHQIPPIRKSNSGIDSTYKLTRRAIDTSEQDTVRLYDADASLWYEFSVYKSNPLYFVNNRKPEVKPFQPLWMVMFRLKAVSRHWYEVIINEETQETKYTLISDPVLGRSDLERYIINSGSITFDKEKNPLREAPGGKVKEVQYQERDRYFTQRIYNDWVLVHTEKTGESGWIRWKKDRDILVGYMLNNHELPKQ